MKPLYWLLCAAMTCSTALAAADKSALRAARPRLFLGARDIPQIRQLAKSDPTAQQMHKWLTSSARRMLNEEPIERVLIGPRLLDKSRTALQRISTLAGLYLIDGNREYADRAKREMLTAAAFSDWNPSHFLDVAEMTTALAIGYDWLYDYLAPDERKTIREAIVKHGLQPGLKGFEKRVSWTHSHHNWGQVCCGGLLVGALALADEEPQLAAALLAGIPEGLKSPMKAFAPDGGIAEGPGYWGYATIYNVYALAALETAMNTDWGLKATSGFPETGFFRIHCVGPIARTFSFADAGDGAGLGPQMFWLARQFKQPAFVAHELSMLSSKIGLFHLLWYAQLPPDLRSAGARPLNLPLDAVFRGVDVAFFRSAFGDRNATFVGIKGGDNAANHSHLDLGSFVLDAQGHRWAVDLGSDNYNLPGYFGKQRWTYYRLRTESHNTLTLNGENQEPKGKAPIIAYHSTPQRAHTVIDLTDGYRTQATQVKRGLALLNRSAVLVQDQVRANEPVDVVWNFVTPATIDAKGTTATLSIDSAKMTARILSPRDARFEVISANPPEPQKQQPGMRNLTVRLPAKTANATIAVLIAPASGSNAAPAIVPLEQWPGGDYAKKSRP